MALPTSTKDFADVIAQYATHEWGFSGTRAGMSPFQTSIVRQALIKGQPKTLHHGGAYGSDSVTHRFCHDVSAKTEVHIWPADEKRAAYFTKSALVTIHPVMDPLTRNRIIADRSTLLIATPHTEQEEVHSGTWMTIRTMLKLAKPVLIVWPKSKLITLHLDHVLYRVVMRPETQP